MKKFSLKKITAAVSAAAMIATMGTTAFAANVIQSSSGITIKGITVTQRTDNSELYNVSVVYETTEVQDIGTTMLTYVKHGDALSSVTAYDKGTMNIVGIDQKNDTSAFTFTVTTDTSASNGIYMIPGEAGLLMLSGDKVGGTPAVATLAIAALKVTNTELGDIAIINGADATETAKKNAIINAVGAVKFTNTDGVSEDVTLAAENVTLTETGATITYEGYSVDVTASFVAKAFEVTGMKLLKADGSEYKVDSFQNGTANTTDTVKSKISKIVVTGAAVDGVVPSETWNVGENGATVDVTGTPVEDGTATYTVTVTAPTAGVFGAIPSGFTMPTINVEFTADPTKIVTSVILTGTGVSENTIEVEKGTSLEKAVNGISFALKNSDGIDLPTTGWALSDFTSADYNADQEGTYTATATLSGSSDDAIIKDEALKTVTLTIKVNDSTPAYKYGDVNNDGVIDYTDVGEIIAYITASSEGEEYPFVDANNSEKTVPLQAADVTADFKSGEVVVDYSDVGEVIAKITAESEGESYDFEADK